MPTQAQINAGIDARYNAISPKRAARIEAANPTHVGTRNGVSFFECPIGGDAAHLLHKVNGVWFYSDFYEFPQSGEI